MKLEDFEKKTVTPSVTGETTDLDAMKAALERASEMSSIPEPVVKALKDAQVKAALLSLAKPVME